MLGRNRTITVVSALTLALGVGLNTAIFSVLESILLRPLPYPAADRIVSIWRDDGAGHRSDETSVWTMQQWRDRSRSIESIAVYDDGQFTFVDNGQAEVLRGMRVSSQFFDTLGVRMRFGRNFMPDEERIPHENVVIMGSDLWHRRFGADPAIVGRVLQLNGHPTRVIAVLPADFHPIHMSNPAEVPQIFSTADYDPVEAEACHSCTRSGRIIARLRPSVAAGAASVELTSINRELARLYPAGAARYPAVHAELLVESLVGPVRGALWLLFGAVTLVMLIACANVAGIQLARASARQREFAVRSALGAGRRMLVSQLLTENLLLAVIGGAAGMLAAPLVTAALVARAPAELPRLDDVHVDGRVLLFALATTFATGMVFGLVPALSASRFNLNDVLKRSSGISGRAAGARVRNAVVVVALALAFALVVSTGLLGRSVMNLEALDAGFDGHNVLTLTPGGNYSTREARMTYLRTLVSRVEAVAGVQSAGLISNVPLSHVEPRTLRIDREVPADGGVLPTADVFWVSPGYFRTLRIPLKRGRILQERDGEPNAEHGAVISETLARQRFNNVDPIGEHIEIGQGDTTLVVVGVVGDVRYAGLDRLPGAAVYVPQGINPDHYTRLVARTSGDPMRFERAVRAAIRDIDPTQPLFHVQPMDNYVASSLADRRFAFALITLFGILALVLASIGIYGLVSYSVVQRTPEIGVRTALGATRTRVIVMILRQGMGVTAIGLCGGAAIALVAGRLISNLLFGVDPSDPATLAATAAVLALAAAVASVIPARAAVRVDPLMALRSE